MKTTCVLVLLGLLMDMAISTTGKLQVKRISFGKCSNPLTKDQCKKVAEEQGKTLFIISRPISSYYYPQDCYFDAYYKNFLYFNEKPSSRHCTSIRPCICNKKDKKYRCNGINNGCCTQGKPCSEGDGDCDNYKECAKGLTCGVNNCEWGGYDDCCVKPDCSRCKFPFTYDGKTYHQCKASSIKGKSWCSVKTTSSGQHISGHWEYCPDGDRCEDCSRCKFPFTYYGKTYHHCKASSAKGKTWCSAKTTSTGQHVSGNWLYCPAGDKCKETCSEPHTDLLGNDLYNINNIADWEVCGELCRNEDKCNAWTWHTSKSTHAPHRCYLKSSDAGRKTLYHGVISGVKTCPVAGIADCWARNPGSCVKSHNIVLHDDKSVEECKQVCIETAGCVAFEYGTDYGGSGKYKPGDCRPQSSNLKKDCDGTRHNLDLYILTKCSKGDNRTLTISEDKPKKLTCPPHQDIKIYSATYGAPSKKCFAPTAFIPLVHLVQIECKGKKECKIKASKFVKHDPCPGMKKYFKVVYTCI